MTTETENVTLRFHNRPRVMVGEPDGFLPNGLPVWWYRMPSNETKYLLTRKAKNPTAKGFTQGRDLTDAEYQSMRFPVGSSAEEHRRAVCRRGMERQNATAENLRKRAEQAEAFEVPPTGTVGCENDFPYFMGTPGRYSKENVWGQWVGTDAAYEQQPGESWTRACDRNRKALTVLVTDADAARALQRHEVKRLLAEAEEATVAASEWAEGLRD